MTKTFLIPALVVLLTYCTAPTLAQTLTGSISGVVTDSTGGVLPGVSVTLSGGTIASRTQITGERGGYSFRSIPIGVYTISFELAGFRSVVRGQIIVELGRALNLPISMEVAGVAETITVTGESPLVDTKSSTIGTNVNEDFLQNIPNARDVWVVLEETAGVVLDKFNVGGSESGGQSVFSSAGTSWSQNQYNINGVNTTDPQALGSSSAYYSYDSFEEIQVSTSGHSAEVAAPGVFLNLQVKTGGNEVHGGGAYYFENEDMQSDNLDQELIDQGVSEANPFKRYFDWSLEFGGPIWRDKLWGYGHLSEQQIEPYIVGYYLPDGTQGIDLAELKNYTLRFEGQVSGEHRAGFMYFQGNKLKPNRGAGRTRPTPETTLYQKSSTKIYQGLYTGVLGEKMLLDGRFSLMDMDFPVGQQPDLPADAYSRLDLTTSIWSAGPGTNTIHQRKRYQVVASLSYFNDNWINSSHDMKFGFEWSENPAITTNDLNGAILYRDLGIQPYQVNLYSHPVVVENRTKNMSIFAQDNATVKRLTLNLGARFDYWTAEYPEQVKPAGPWDDVFYSFGLPRSVPGRFGIVDFKNVSPRLGLSYALTEDQKTVVRANFSRYYAQIMTGVAGYVNPNGVSTLRYRFNDLDGDRLLDPGEWDPSSPILRDISGGESGNDVDPNMKSPYTDELTVSLQRELMPDLSISASFIWREDKRIMEDVNIGVPLATAYDAVTALDPGPDLIPGTGDDGRITVYNQKQETLGNDQFLYTNPEPLGNKYRGVMIEARKRLSNKWQMLTSLAIGKSETYSYAYGSLLYVGGTNFASYLFDNPNWNINSWGRSFWDRPVMYRISGTYQAPYGFNLSGVFRTSSGVVRFRSILVEEDIDGVPLNQGSTEVMVEPVGSGRQPRTTLLDFRIEKEFDFGRPGRLGLILDIFNAVNSNMPILIANQADRYGQIDKILPPRILRFGIRYRF